MVSSHAIHRSELKSATVGRSREAIHSNISARFSFCSSRGWPRASLEVQWQVALGRENPAHLCSLYFQLFIAFQDWSASNYLILISIFQCGTTIWNILKALAISIFDGWAPTPLPLPRTIEIRDSRTTSVSNQFLNTTPSFRANSFRKENRWGKTGHGTERCVMVLRIRPRTDLYGWVEGSVSESIWLIVRCSFSYFEIYSGAQTVFLASLPRELTFEFAISSQIFCI